MSSESLGGDFMDFMDFDDAINVGISAFRVAVFRTKACVISTMLAAVPDWLLVMTGVGVDAAKEWLTC